VLHLLEHVEQQGALFTGSLCRCSCIVLPYGSRVECRMQQGIFPFQGCHRLLQQDCLSLRSACRVLERAFAALCRILERILPRAAVLLLPRSMQRIVGTEQLRRLDAVLCVQAETAGIDGVLERVAGDAAGSCRVRDGQLGHGAVLRAPSSVRLPESSGRYW